jgi:carboxyl-terminal processing protease
MLPRSGRRQLPAVLLLFVGFGLGVIATRMNLVPGTWRDPPFGLGQKFDPFWETWHLVREHYVDQGAVHPVAMTRGAIQGMLASLGDVGHTTYVSPEELQYLNTAMTGQLEGIGATMTVRDRQPTVMQTLPDSPARKAGLRPGDVIAKVDGQDVNRLALDRVVQMIRGPAGSVVKLEVLRKGRRLDFEITRGHVEVPAVTWQMLPAKTPVAQIAIRSFGEHADEQLKTALAGARKEGARGLILDVRGDPGGLAKEAVAVTSEFLTGGDVFIEENAEGRRTAEAVKPGGVAPDIPVVVLIDEGTASSAEIFAGALQDHHRGPLVGTRTFGTGTVLQPFPLTDGSAVLLAVAKWLTPSGREIWHQGIAPDIAVTLPHDADVLLPGAVPDLDADKLAHSSDAQLRKGLEVLEKEVEKKDHGTR